METQLSRSEKKRRAKSIEQMVNELATLPAGQIMNLPCEDQLKHELDRTKDLKGGARKRQIKYITKLLREQPIDDLFLYLEEKKGSSLKQKREFHELEHLRDSLINEAVQVYDQWLEGGYGDTDVSLESIWESETMKIIKSRFSGIDYKMLRKLALQFARSHNKRFSRELFRMLKAANERSQFKNLNNS
jgi:ribosome-associated protein